MSNQKEYIHLLTGIKMSDELSEEEKRFIEAMYNSRFEYVHIPLLTEKIIILNNRIKKLTFWTSVYSIILIILTVLLVIVGIITLIKL